MRETKQGVSLIVLVITIIIMIILASAIIITLSNSDIIERANEAVEKTDLQEVQNIASIAWSEAYLDGKTTKAELQTAVESALSKNKVNKDNYIIDVTTKGVKVLEYTLGNLIKSADDYGKTVDYSVTVDIEDFDGDTESYITKKDVTISNWQVLYEDIENRYVFLISADAVALRHVSELSVSRLTEQQKDLYNIFKLGQEGYSLSAERGDNNNVTAWLISNYNSFANTSDYGNYVIGAIGGPTIELLAAMYNSKHGSETIIPIVDMEYEDVDGQGTGYNGKFGYFLNELGNVNVSGIDIDFANSIGKSCWVVSPTASSINNGGFDLLTWWYPFNGYQSAYITSRNYDGALEGIRPVVCLKSDIPATIGTTTDYSLTIE